MDSKNRIIEFGIVVDTVFNPVGNGIEFPYSLAKFFGYPVFRELSRCVGVYPVRNRRRSLREQNTLERFDRGAIDEEQLDGETEIISRFEREVLGSNPGRAIDQ